MDVALGVAVTDRVARLALVDSAAPGTVIDQFVLDVAEHPVEVLTETVVGTDRSLAGENHRLVATRLCWPDQAKADELQHALQDSAMTARFCLPKPDAPAAGSNAYLTRQLRLKPVLRAAPNIDA